jgi:putative hydrolase of the HAD superfamily
MSEPRAIVFDLDGTLYPYAAFQQSGFRAVARTLAADHGLQYGRVIRVLKRAHRTDRRRELQVLCAAFKLPASLVPVLVRVLREHSPSLRLPVETRRLLAVLRTSWRLGILTNGAPRIQRRKVAALGLDRQVDAIVYAAHCGLGRGKPEAAAFRAILRRLGTTPRATLFVGDDLVADMRGAAAVGMGTIHLLAGRRKPACGTACAAHVRRIGGIAVLADRLIAERMNRAR